MAYCIYFCNVLKKQISLLFRVIFSLIIGNTIDSHFSYYISHVFLIRYPHGIRKYKMILMLAPSSLPVYHFSKLMQRENVKWLFSCQCFFQHKARSRIFPEKKRQKLSSSIAKTIVSLYLLLLSYMSQVMLRMSYLVILPIRYIIRYC